MFAVSLSKIRLLGPHLRPLFIFASPAGPRRTKTSKVQNSVVTLHHRGSTEEVLPVYVELAPMARKCAATIATSHHRTITQILRDTACAPSVEHSASSSSGGRIGGAPQRLLHVLVGDGIYSNGLAARILWEWMQLEYPNYRLINFACSTHSSNLVVRTALIGPSQKAASKHVLIANTVRFFKYLVPEYGAEFGARMDTYVLANHATLLPPGADTLRRFETLRRVYGAEVVPASLLEFVGHAHSVEARGPLAAELLRNLLLRSETKPVVTRFFLFAPCIATLFRWLLLRVLSRTEERQKRTKGDNTMKYASGFAFLKNQQTRETENKKGTGEGCPADGCDPVPRRGSLSDCEGRRHAGRSE